MFAKLYSHQVKASHRLLAALHPEKAASFLSSAATCRFMQIYFECSRGGGIKRETRLKALGWLMVQLEELLDIYSFKEYNLRETLNNLFNTFLLVQIKLFNCLVVWLFLKSALWTDEQISLFDNKRYSKSKIIYIQICQDFNVFGKKPMLIFDLIHFLI